MHIKQLTKISREIHKIDTAFVPNAIKELGKVQARINLIRIIDAKLYNIRQKLEARKKELLNETSDTI